MRTHELIYCKVLKVCKDIDIHIHILYTIHNYIGVFCIPIKIRIVQKRLKNIEVREYCLTIIVVANLGIYVHMHVEQQLS